MKMHNRKSGADRVVPDERPPPATKGSDAMKVGIPREVKNHEYRVAITPAGVRELVNHGHEVFVEKDAGVGSQLADDAYTAAGATIIPDADEVWGTADMVLKVKEPIAEEYHRMRPGLTLFTYLHLAADKACTDALLGQQGHRHRLRDGAARRREPAAARADVRGRRAPRPAGRRLPPDAPGRRLRRAARRRPRYPRGQRRRHRRRRLRPARRADRGGHGRARHRPRPATSPGCARSTRSTRAASRRIASNAYEVEKAVLDGRPGHRRGPGHRGQGAQAGLQRPGEAG